MNEIAIFPVRAWRNIVLLAMCAGLSISVYSMTITLSSLIAQAYTDQRWMITFPVAAVVLGSLIASFPTAAIIGILGRKRAFLLVSVLALVGATVIAASMLISSWWGILAGYFIVGLGLSAQEYYVFAANDGLPKQFSGRVSGAILSGGLVAAFVGPNTGRFAQSIELLETPMLAVPVAIVLLVSVKFLLLTQITITSLTEVNVQKPMSIAGVRKVMRLPLFWSAVLVTSCGFGAMTLIMNATTPWMFDHGMMLDHSTMVISLHILGMFAPAPISGWLVDRIGTVKGAVLGFALMIIAMLILFFYHQYIDFMVALIMLGVGWSLTQVSGTKRVIMLAGVQRAEFEGGNVLLINFAKICASTFAGTLYIAWGSAGVIGISALYVTIGLFGVLFLPRLYTKDRSVDQALL